MRTQEAILIGGGDYKLTVILSVEATIMVSSAINRQEAMAFAKEKLAAGDPNGFEIANKPSSYKVLKVERV